MQLLRGPEGPDPKLLAMSQLHMLGDVLAALFGRLHQKEAAAAAREQGLYALLHEHRVPLPPSLLPNQPDERDAEPPDEGMHEVEPAVGGVDGAAAASASLPGAPAAAATAAGACMTPRTWRR